MTHTSKLSKSLTRYSEADLPTQWGRFRLLIYRLDDDASKEHAAMVFGTPQGAQTALCRVHSECFTSEVMGSLRCDCREQLDRALDRIAAEGCGVLVYWMESTRHSAAYMQTEQTKMGHIAAPKNPLDKDASRT